MEYQSANDDPIELPEPFDAGIGEDNKESIGKAFDKVLDKSKRNGISPNCLRSLSKLLDATATSFELNSERTRLRRWTICFLRAPTLRVHSALRNVDTSRSNENS